MDTPVESVRRLLINATSDALCDSCLAEACGLTLTMVEPITAALRLEAAFTQGSTCSSCHRTVPTTIAAPKCAQSSLPLDAGDPGFSMDQDRLHIHCLTRLLTDEKVRLSRAVSRRARALIEQSRRRMRNGGTSPHEE
jgi:hypothetical protein